ncbi:hypothetical protein [Nocardia bovistercoris]|uniref:Uncharacterized protein n=1 Tax=Nocardia bovistercoris TaxID=2785916 RepID=A0A931IC92_9NOCA|nr:hypothetical protein [Nocardia bovistercoris]MBH0778749.1 hypothetical protein [Nocardia bovistercoris]
MSGPLEYGFVARVDHRMVYVDYGYPNPVWPRLGNVIATHPSNLRMESAAPQQVPNPRIVAPVFSDAPAC